MIKYYDTYFLDANKALEEAKKKNRVLGINSRITFEQICYYNAEEELENAPSNCIFVPFENVYNYFVTTKNRRPEKLNYDNVDMSKEDRKELTASFTAILKLVEEEREALAQLYKEQIQNYKPDFSDEKLRVLIPANKNSTVMKHISKNVARAFEETGKYEVCYLIQENDMQDMDYLIYYHKVDEFKPHITFNINHMNNEFLNEYVYNFIWFQDTMEIVTNDEPLNQRERDYILCLLPGVKNALENKGAKNTQLQDFCIDTSIYKKRPDIKKEKKIVFIGGSYKDNTMPYENSLKVRNLEENITEKVSQNIIKEILDIYRSNGVFNEELKKFFARKFNVSIQYINNYIIPLVIRDYTLLELVESDIDYEIEVYGWGWDKYEELKPYYKGILEYGEEISKIYNSASYAIVTHPSYLIQQRTLECAASNCTPLVYDCTYIDNSVNKKHINSLVLFKNLEELKSILSKDPLATELDSFVANYTYKTITDKVEKVLSSEN